MFIYLVVISICFVIIAIVSIYLWKKRELIAFEIIKKKANKGLYQSQMLLGFMYYTGHGLQKDVSKAIEWFTKAAEQNEPQSQMILSNIYLNGENGEKDINTGIMWLKRASDNGLDTAQVALATLYADGSILPKNVKESIRLFNLAAEKGNITAQKTIAGIYHFSIGLDKTLAYAWYMVAANQGDEYAKDIANKLFSEFSPTDKDKASSLAIEFINKYHKKNKGV